MLGPNVTIIMIYHLLRKSPSCSYTFMMIVHFYPGEDILICVSLPVKHLQSALRSYCNKTKEYLPAPVMRTVSPEMSLACMLAGSILFTIATAQ